MTEHNEYYYDLDRNMDSTYPIKKVENKVKYKFDWHLEKVSSQVIKLLKEKNRAYGNTALNPTNIFSKLESTEAICARIDDKLARIKNKGITDKTEDSIDDLIGYLFLLKMSLNQ
tara:strand:+ start:4697 stop:5041 length:345 start_codon:yes stop_codon:yes gene_type:complete